jgi:hypothetical protein
MNAGRAAMTRDKFGGRSSCDCFGSAANSKSHSGQEKRDFEAARTTLKYSSRDLTRRHKSFGVGRTLCHQFEIRWIAKIGPLIVN